MSSGEAPVSPQVTAVRVVSTCGTIDGFVSLFSRLFDVDQMWILTPQVMPAGSRLAVLITLSDGEVALSFTGDVLGAFPASAPTPYASPGMLVKILSVPPASRPVMQRLHEASAEFGQSTRATVLGDTDREPASIADMESDVETVEPAEQEEAFGGGAAQEEIFSASFAARQRTTSETVPQPIGMTLDPTMAPPPVVEFVPVSTSVDALAPKVEEVDEEPAKPQEKTEARSAPVPAPEAAAPAVEITSAAPPQRTGMPVPLAMMLIALAFLAGYWLG